MAIKSLSKYKITGKSLGWPTLYLAKAIVNPLIFYG